MTDSQKRRVEKLEEAVQDQDQAEDVVIALVWGPEDDGWAENVAQAQRLHKQFKDRAEPFKLYWPNGEEASAP